MSRSGTRSRFLALYLLLAGALTASAVGFVLLVASPAATKAKVPWSAWQPAQGGTVAMITAIARHVEAEYRLSSGGRQLLAIAAKSPPVILDDSKDLLIAEVAVRESGGAIQNFDTANTAMFTLCGSGADCSIAGGQASLARARLTRREALELALYSFEFLPRLQSVIAFLPPPPGEPQTVSLYFERQALAAQLARPLRATLPLSRPPLPTSPDRAEAHTIEALTLPVAHVFELAQLQSGGAVLILEPLPS